MLIVLLSAHRLTNPYTDVSLAGAFLMEPTNENIK